jgi:glycosyltransferase involved in cell wall biosynthesis
VKKRVIHLLSSNSYSGAENVAINIITSLSQEYEFVYASPSGPIEKLLAERKIPHLPVNRMNPFHIRSICKQWKPDIIHAHDFRASIVSAATLYPCTKISHLHQNPTWARGLNFNSLLYTLSSPMYGKIAVVSSEILREAIFSGIIRNKTVVLKNNVDIENVIKSSADINLSEKYDLVFVGRLTDVKDPLRFIDIISKIIEYKQNIKVAMVGDGDLRGECEGKIKHLQLEKNIKIMGFLSNPFGVMNNSKLLVMTSKWEGFGLVAVESMIMGKPVVASSVGGLKSIINKDCGKLCETDEEFVSCIMQLLEDQSYYQLLSYNANKSASEYGEKSRWVNELKQLYI